MPFRPATWPLIHGPPGTGKTTTVVELIRRAVRDGRKVLACAPSNMAVDNIFERLVDAGEETVRLGHPARVMPNLRARTLDLLVKDHEDVRLSHKLVKEAMGLFRRAGRYTRARPAPGGTPRSPARGQESAGRCAAFWRPRPSNRFSTTPTSSVPPRPGLSSRILGARRFDLAVIDEACQSTEPGCWIPLLSCDRVVLAGDHCQLPPTVVSPEAAAQGLSVSLFERFIGLHGPSIARRLTVQYRMNEAIADFFVAGILRRRFGSGRDGRRTRPGRLARRLFHAADPVAVGVRRHRRSGLRRGGGTRRREPPQPAGGGPGVPQGRRAGGFRRGPRVDRRDCTLRGPGAALCASGSPTRIWKSTA